MPLDQQLEQELEQAMLEICARAAAEHRISLISPKGSSDGPRALARRLLEREGQTSKGFRQLVQAGRFDLTFESLVLQARFRTLFNGRERVEARARLIDAIATAVNSAAQGRPIDTLQAARAMRHGLTSVPALFGAESIRRKEGYAYHVGGSDELQLHIALVGFGREPWFRYGVGFAVPRMQSETDPSVFAAKVARFNEFLRTHPDRFAHLQLQHHRHGEVSSYDPGPIPNHFLRPPSFIFLGVHVPFNELAMGRMMDLLDALLPLYHYVEAATEMPESDAANRWPDGSLPDPREWRTGLRFTVDRTLRRRLLQAALKAHLETVHGDDVVASVADGDRGTAADVMVHGNGATAYYGVSTALTVRGCLREVLGRLLESALWPDTPQHGRLVVVGEPEPGAADHAYVERLQAQLGVTVQYQQIDPAAC